MSDGIDMTLKMSYFCSKIGSVIIMLKFICDRLHSDSNEHNMQWELAIVSCDCDSRL